MDTRGLGQHPTSCVARWQSQAHLPRKAARLPSRRCRPAAGPQVPPTPLEAGPSRRPLTRALGVDYGRRNVGLAVSTMGLAPRPLPALPGGSGQMEVAGTVVQAAREAGCDGIVVGLPVTLKGSLDDFSTDSQQGRRCRNFAQSVATLASSWGLGVYLVDERGTTAEAELAMTLTGSRKADIAKKRDSVAAALILAAYFDVSEAALLVEPTRFDSPSGQRWRREPTRSSSSSSSSGED